MLKTVNVHPMSLSLDRSGVVGYFQPIDERVQDKFSQRLAEELIQIVNDGDIDNSYADEVLWLSVVYIVIELTNIFYCRSLIEKSREKGLNIVREWRGENSLKKYDGLNTIITHIGGRHGRALTVHTTLRSMLRWVVGTLRRRDGFSRVPPLLMDKNSDVLCFGGDEAMVDHAKLSGKRLVLGTLEQWFGSFNPLAETSHAKEFRAFASRTSQVSHKIANEVGLGVQDMSEIAENSVFEVLSLVSNYFSHISGKGKMLPNELWLGSGGNLYNRTLARAAQKQGKRVVSFDHGSGSGWIDIPLVRLIDVDFCDNYLSFTEGQAAGIARLRRQSLKVTRATDPQIGVSPFPLFARPRLADERQKSSRPRAMYVPSIYEAGMTLVPPLIAEMPAIDFQVKLLCGLRDLGYDVVLKPHPECRVGVPNALLEVTGAQLEVRRFEEVCNESDVLLFDYLTTSAIRSAFFTKTSLVLIDHGRVPIQPEAMLELEERAAFFQVERDVENRPIFSNEHLEGVIQLASKRRESDRFLHNYFDPIDGFAS
ncbi:hypothetical protein [Thalassospira povalilytica]|uniref:hypothetical protein n=1 Tax=Thalassospira povalilytica TaxID=732237 RepID=UPI003AA942E9